MLCFCDFSNICLLFVRFQSEKPLSIVVRGVVREAFAEACVERGLFTGSIEMRDIAEAYGAHESDTLAALFRADRGYRGGQSAGVLPERIGRAMQEVRHDYCDHAEMTEDRDRIVIWTDGIIIIAVTLVAVVRKKCIKFAADREVFLVDLGVFDKVGFLPKLRIVDEGLFIDVCGEDIP